MTTIAEVARTFMSKVNAEGKVSGGRRKEILRELCIKYGVSASDVGKYLSRSSARKRLENKKKSALAKPFKVTPTRILEAVNICRNDRHDHLLPDP